MYLNFIFLDQFLFELLCKNTHTQKHTQTHTNSIWLYSIVVFCKNNNGHFESGNALASSSQRSPNQG